MCVAMLADGEFDPELCPLLAGLPADERARRLGQPWAKNCIERRKARAEVKPQTQFAGSEAKSDVPPVPCRAMIT